MMGAAQRAGIIPAILGIKLLSQTVHEVLHFCQGHRPKIAISDSQVVLEVKTDVK